MLKRAMNTEIEASYALMDTWFTQQPLIKVITKQGLDVIGMVKNLKQRYLVAGSMSAWINCIVWATPSDGKKAYYTLFIQHRLMVFRLRLYSSAIGIRKVIGSLF